MKKFLAIAMIASVTFVACNDGETETTTTEDSTAITTPAPDTTVTAPITPDTTVMVDTTAATAPAATPAP